MKKSKKVLKSYFETGDRPTEGQFGDLIDSFVHVDGSSAAQNNKIRVVDLGVIKFIRSRRSPTVEDAIVAKINGLEIPLVVAEDEQVIFEFDLKVSGTLGDTPPQGERA